MGGVLLRQLQLDLVGIFSLRPKLQRLSIGVAVIAVADVGQVELHERQDDLRLLLRPVEKV